MELTDTLKVLLRRWYIVLLGLALSVCLGLIVHRAIPATYEAGGSILLMPAETVVDEEVGNPYLYMGGMADALDVLIIRAGAADMRSEVLEGFEGANYTVVSDPTTPTPIINVAAEGSSREESMELMRAAMASVVDVLDGMQDELELPDAARIRPAELTVDSSATEVTGQANKAAVAAVGAGVLGTFMVTALVDGMLTRRSRSRSQGEGGLADVAPADPPPRRPVAANTSVPTLAGADEVADRFEDGDKDGLVGPMLNISASR